MVAGATAPPPGGPTSLDITAQVFARPVGHGGAEMAVVLLNRADSPTTLSVAWAELGIAPEQKMRVRDVIKREDLPGATGNFSALVGSHDVAFVRLTKVMV